MAFGVGIGLFVLAALVIVLLSRSEITNMWVLVGGLVVAAALMSVYAVANFIDPSHIKTTKVADCNDDAFSKSEWQDARAAGDGGRRTRKHARDVIRCGRVQGQTGADVRTLLGPPDRRTGTSASRTWRYTAAGDEALAILFVGGRAVSAQAAPE